MQKPVVDYRGFRLSRIGEPQYAHLLYLLGWAVYFALYILTENLIPAQRCHPVHCRLDDLIPFCEVFVIPYVFWYFLILLSLYRFGRYDPENFKRMQIFFFVTQLAATAVYLLYPTRQELRPAVFPRENLLTDVVALLYAADTNTGVCPSLHAAGAIGIASAWLKSKSASALQKALIVLSAVLICLSTVFIKQHSAVDVLAALPLSLLAEAVAYGRSYWLPRLKKHR